MSEGTHRKRGRPTEVEREERRNQILDAAVDLFTTNGYGQATIDELASRSRVTKRTVYTYFGDKAEVFSAAVERFRLRALGDLAHAGETLAEVSTNIVYVLHADDAVAMHRLMIGESLQFPELAFRFYESGPQGYIDLLKVRLASSAVREHAESLAVSLFGLLLGEAHRRRLLGLSPAPTRDDSRRYALEALRLLGIQEA